MVKFTESTGAISAAKVPTYKYRDGLQKVRIVGDILPRYLFWVPNPRGTPKQLPVEALCFQRDQEAWDNAVTEPAKQAYPGIEPPKWSYSALCVTESGDLEVLPFKKTLWTQIKDTAETLGDPTDPDSGWWIVFRKKKTGPNPMNVEYSLDALKSSKEVGPLSAELKEKIAEHKTIGEIYPRPTESDVVKNIANIMSSGDDAEVDEEATDEFKVE
jgi:hypothetical protein